LSKLASVFFPFLYFAIPFYFGFGFCNWLGFAQHEAWINGYGVWGGWGGGAQDLREASVN